MKIHEDHTKEFLHFLEWRREDNKNIWKSFTYGSCFYDFMISRTRPYTERQEEWNMIQAYVCSLLDISRDTADILKPRALLEALDISQLDEIARILYLNRDDNETY